MNSHFRLTRLDAIAGQIDDGAMILHAIVDECIVVWFILARDALQYHVSHHHKYKEYHLDHFLRHNASNNGACGRCLTVDAPAGLVY